MKQKYTSLYEEMGFFIIFAITFHLIIFILTFAQIIIVINNDIYTFKDLINMAFYFFMIYGNVAIIIYLATPIKKRAEVKK